MFKMTTPRTLTLIACAAMLSALVPPLVPAQTPAAAPAKNKPITPAWPALTPSTIYTPENAPAAPALESLPLKPNITQYGITWTFDKPARVGQFVNTDYYVVGPVTVTAIDPKPLYGKDIADAELDSSEKRHKEDDRIRNGFMLNPPAAQKVAYDSGVRNFFDPSLIQKLPVSMKPGDSLVATVSTPVGVKINAQLKGTYGRGTRLAAVLTCVAAPQPADAFRPGFCDRSAKIYLARNLKRDLLPTVATTKSAPSVEQYVGFTQKPWVGTGFFAFEQPVENMPMYGREYGLVSGSAALLLCTDLKPEQKEPLLINYVQVGIDLGAMIRAGHPGWEAFGGHGSGRKLPIVFAGLLLGDDQLANISQYFPKASFGEDEQTAYGTAWTGAKVVFTGHRGINEATGVGRPVTGPYEQKQPSEWTGIAEGPDRTGDKCSESYRRCCTSSAWIGEVLSLRLLKAEKAWHHDAFFDYCDRWMYENDAEFIKTIKAGTGADYSPEWDRQGQAWDTFDGEMWSKYRTAPGMPPTDGWTKQHDDSYLRNAIEKMKK